jgi:hypothetical protein
MKRDLFVQLEFRPHQPKDATRLKITKETVDSTYRLRTYGENPTKLTWLRLYILSTNKHLCYPKLGFAMYKYQVLWYSVIRIFVLYVCIAILWLH